MVGDDRKAVKAVCCCGRALEATTYEAVLDHTELKNLKLALDKLVKPEPVQPIVVKSFDMASLDRAFADLRIAQGWRLCHKCGATIMKNGGCAHMSVAGFGGSLTLSGRAFAVTSCAGTAVVRALSKTVEDGLF